MINAALHERGAGNQASATQRQHQQAIQNWKASDLPAGSLVMRT